MFGYYNGQPKSECFLSSFKRDANKRLSTLCYVNTVCVLCVHM